MPLPPQHRIDHQPIYISREDQSWEIEKVIEEQEEIEKKYADDPIDYEAPDAREKIIDRLHPFEHYYAGLSRYDLDANNLRDYLDKANPPVMFKFRRLTISEYEDVVSTMKNTGQNAGYRNAFQLCIKGIDNANLDIKFRPNGGLTAAEMEKLRDVIQLKYIYECGEAIVRASGDLTAIEKKA